tara:strand:- start:61 stop:462 length:402 start_codon:yes stop_codon:yes gene_type:complete
MVDSSSKPRFVCFNEKNVGSKYIDYAADFRARNRIWPSLDMSKQNRKLELNEEVRFPYGSPQIIKRSLEIESFDLNTINLIARRTNVSFYCVVRFNGLFDDHIETIDIAGQELDGVVSLDDFGEWMDLSLKTK